MTDLVVRRAVWLTALNLVFSLGLFGLTLANLYWQWSRGESLVTGGLFAFVAGYYAMMSFNQLRDRQPQIVISASGLGLPSAAADPIPWSRILHLRVRKSLIPTLGGRIDLQVDPEIFLKLKFGQRFLGDAVLKGRGIPNTFAVRTQGMDRGTAEIETALKRHWPPHGA
jgi:hypothetical protein